MIKMTEKQKAFVLRFYLGLGISMYLLLLVALMAMLKIHNYI